jgi:5-methylcytosine-specific restriction endonuclease McrA
MKLCCFCQAEKPLFDFYKEKRAKDGYSYRCKECDKKKSTKWRLDNPDKRKEVQQKYFMSNKELFNESCMRRYASKKKSTPSWLTQEDIIKIRCYYQVAQMRNRESGIKWHVDHIVPLRGKTVSGLHVPWNLQVIPARDNIRKGNKHDQGEW